MFVPPGEVLSWSMTWNRPLRGIRAGIPAAGPVPARTELVVLTGAEDTVVDPRDARAIYRGAETVDRTLETITARGASDHIAPQRATPIARRTFWTRLDSLLAHAR